jgi:outer membrane protein insertion porin family
LSVLQLQPRRLFGVISRGYYVPETIEADLHLLRKLYRSRGFLDAVVSFGGIELNATRSSAEVTLRVNEGPAFTLQGVRVEGQRLFPSRLLEREAGISTGGRFSGEDVDAGLQRLIRWYEERADIAPRIGVRLEYGDDETVTAVYTVFEEEHYSTGRVHIAGNRMTKDRVVRSDVTLIPGKPFTRIELDRTLKRMEKRGLYESVEVSEEAGEAPETRDVTLTVKEREHMGFFEVGGGGSSGAGGVAYAAIRHSNLDLFRLPVSWSDWRGAFVGGGQKLEVEIIPGSRESEYRFRFVEPYFLRSDQALMLAGGPSFLDRRTYEEARLRGVIAIEKHFDRDRTFSASLAYVAEAVEIKNVRARAPPDAVAVRGETFLAYPRLELRFSDVDSNYYSGPAGLSASSRLDVAGRATGSETAFARATFSAEGWWPLLDRRPDFRHVFHVGVHTGWIDGIGGDDPPLFERFYLGGPRTFPGFGYRRLGPDQGGTPVGGEGVLHGTVSYSLPLFWREVRAFARFDWGDLEPSFSRIDTGRFRTAAGGGLELRLKIAGQPFPATFFWMQALSSERGDRESLFSFTIGLPF